MTLDEAIIHAKELSEDQSICKDCREEHKQLAEWLEQLRDYKNIFEEEHPFNDNSFNFLNFKIYSNSTLERFTKDELIDYINILYFKWLKSPHKNQTYKLSQFEYDLIKTFDHCKECCLLNEIECLKKLTQKGYFNGIDPFTKVHDIIDNCEVIQ